MKYQHHDNNSESQLSDVEEQLDHYQQQQFQQHQLQQLDERHLAEADCTCSGGNPEIKKDVADFRALITDYINDIDGSTGTYLDISNVLINCWNIAGVMDMEEAFYYQAGFNDPLECLLEHLTSIINV
jgi:hypothetical protein